MKYLNIITFLTLLLMSCGKETSDSRDCREVTYNTNINLQVGDEICFPDGNTLTFTRIEHQLCPCGSICIWQGDLFVTFTTSMGSITKEKVFYPINLDNDRSIFTNHEISAFSYTYGNDNEEVPPCAEDFDSEKIKLTMSISML